MGIPVLGSILPEQCEVLNRSGGGICVNYDTDSFSSEIINLLNKPEKLTEMGAAGKNYVLKERTYKKIADKIENYYSMLN